MVPTSGSNKTRTVGVSSPPALPRAPPPPHHSSVSVVRGAHPATSLSRTERESPPPHTYTLNTVGVSKLDITFQCEYINSYSLLC